MKNLIAPVLVLAATLVCGCATTRNEPHPSTAKVASSGAAANDNLNAVAWSQTAIEHDLILREVYRIAGEKLLVALKDRQWDALPREERKGSSRRLKPAVILDIDETVLDNSPYQARLVDGGGEYNEFTWSEWCREKAAKPLPGALEFTQLAARNGVSVFYLSNRAQDLNDVTLENLRSEGFPVGSSEQMFLGLGTVVAGCEQNGTEKGCRRQLVGRKHRVLLQIGDQLGDFVDVLANTPAGRRAAIAPYEAWLGTRWFVLPNPTYGSWEPALFNNEWAKTAAERRQAKLDGLRK